jgi:hypothetical protein
MAWDLMITFSPPQPSQAPMPAKLLSVFSTWPPDGKLKLPVSSTA